MTPAPRRPGPASDPFVWLITVVAVLGLAAEIAAWTTISRVGLDHAPAWALWLAFTSR